MRYSLLGRTLIGGEYPNNRADQLRCVEPATEAPVNQVNAKFTPQEERREIEKPVVEPGNRERSATHAGGKQEARK